MNTNSFALRTLIYSICLYLFKKIQTHSSPTYNLANLHIKIYTMYKSHYKINFIIKIYISIIYIFDEINL